MEMRELTLEKFEEASEIVGKVTQETKLIYSEYFSEKYGNKIYFKPENMQRTGAYKVRGAYYKIQCLSPEEREKGLITASAGNHAQGVAYAAKLSGVKATVVMPVATPLIKVNRTRALGADVVYNHADFRLMSRRAVCALMDFPERNLFLRGMVRLLGFRQSEVYYDRHERFAGESKYPLRKMLGFALDGITSFSVKPLKLISNLGVLISILSIFGLLYALISYFLGVTVSGWTAIVCSIWLLGGLQMLCLGVVGGYIGKIYSEVKARPRYRVEEYLENPPRSKE